MSDSKAKFCWLEKVHDPKGPDIDICFVHGLGGDPQTTWTLGNVFWPKDLLPYDIPKARILTFGYKAEILSFSSHPKKNAIEEYAKHLNTQLFSLRSETTTLERPIIFVAHSLGGLVCAKVWTLAHGCKKTSS